MAFANKGDAIWAASGSILGGLSAPVFVAAGDYNKDSAPKVALDDAGNASLVWSQTTRTEVATRSPAGPGVPRRCSPPSPPARWPPRSTAPGTRSRCSGRLTPGTWPAAPGAGRPLAGLIVRRAGRRRSRRHLRLRRQQRQRVPFARRHQLRSRQRITRHPGRPEDRPGPGRDAGGRDRIGRSRALTAGALAAGVPRPGLALMRRTW